MPTVEVTAADGTTAKVVLPSGLWRVAWLEGFGWPRCERRENATRTYDDQRRAAKLIHAIEAQPEHHVYLGAFATTVEWHPVTRESLLQVMEEHRDDDRDDDLSDPNA